MTAYTCVNCETEYRNELCLCPACGKRYCDACWKEHLQVDCSDEQGEVAEETK